MIPLNLAEVGPWGLFLGLVVFVVVSIAKGWLWTKPQVDIILARAVAAETGNEKLVENNRTLIEAQLKQAAVGETVEKLVAAIQDRQKVGDSA